MNGSGCLALTLCAALVSGSCALGPDGDELEDKDDWRGAEAEAGLLFGPAQITEDLWVLATNVHRGIAGRYGLTYHSHVVLMHMVAKSPLPTANIHVGVVERAQEDCLFIWEENTNTGNEVCKPKGGLKELFKSGATKVISIIVVYMSTLTAPRVSNVTWDQRVVAAAVILAIATVIALALLGTAAVAVAHRDDPRPALPRG